MCSMDCFHCSEPDCTMDKLTVEERKEQDEHDREIIGGRKYGREKVVWDYQHTGKGRAAAKRYNSSDKGKASRKRYRQTEKGKAAAKRKMQSLIESGKNAENCRAYYERQKLKKAQAAAENHESREPKVLYMEVTKDEFEFPVAVAGSVKELAHICGVSKNTICSAMSHAKKHGYKSIYIKVDLEESEE